MRKSRLRSGFTTGACAAASAKAAVQLLLYAKNNNTNETPHINSVTIALPSGEKASFKINNTLLTFKKARLIARASTIKFAGDDPDVTNGAEIIAEAAFNVRFPVSSNNKTLHVDAFNNCFNNKIKIVGGKGVGIITKPGLPVQVGYPAINPVPQQMIRNSVIEAFFENGHQIEQIPDLAVNISVKDGEKIAAKTLNPRLGIIGGISILGTTGIVKPLSSEAWTATITACMDVAKASGCEIIVLSAGRASEKAHMKKFSFAEESYVMMGDYIEFALTEAKKHEFKEIHLSAQWAKMLKIAMSTPQTHVRYGAIDLVKTSIFLSEKNIEIPKELEFNTAREIFQYLESTSQSRFAFKEVCKSAKKYSEQIARPIPVTCTLVSYDGEVILSE